MAGFLTVLKQYLSPSSHQSRRLKCSSTHLVRLWRFLTLALLLHHS